MIKQTIKQKLVPKPPTTPQVINSAATLSVAKPLKILPNPKRKIPSNAVTRAPILRITVALGTARSEMHAGHNEPTNASVEDE